MEAHTFCLTLIGSTLAARISDTHHQEMSVSPLTARASELNLLTPCPPPVAAVAPLCPSSDTAEQKLCRAAPNSLAFVGAEGTQVPDSFRDQLSPSLKAR